MIVAIMKHLLSDAGIEVSYSSALAAMKEAGESGRYQTVGEAANDQETWCRMYEINQQEAAQQQPPHPSDRWR